MPDPAHAPQSVTCPACGKAYRFKPEYAGRKVKCTCGQVMRMPERAGGSAVAVGSSAAKSPRHLPPPPEPPDSSPQASYELSHEPTSVVSAAVKPGRCPNCGGNVKPSAVICINCGFNLHTRQKVVTASDSSTQAPPVAPVLNQSLDHAALAASARRAQADAQTAAETAIKYRRRDIHLPLILLGISVVLILLNALVLGPMTKGASSASGSVLGISAELLIYSGVRFAIQMPLLLVSIFIVARIFGSNYGTLGIALLKLAALTLMTSGFNDSLVFGLDIVTGGYGSLGFIMQMALSYGLFYLLCYVLFEMDTLETTVLYVLMFLLPVVILVFGGAILMSLFP